MHFRCLSMSLYTVFFFVGGGEVLSQAKIIDKFYY